MSRTDAELSQRLNAGLDAYLASGGALPGLQQAAARATFIRQVIESVHRVRYPRLVASRDISLNRGDPNHSSFDPLKAAILCQRAAELDEACWLVFLFVHFGKSPKVGWRYVREIYGQLGAGERWTWAAVSSCPAAFRVWLHEHQATLTRGTTAHAFGNHRKYQSLDALSDRGTGATVESYVSWVQPPRTHVELIAETAALVGNDPKRTFGALYRSMEPVVGFGRTARFDYVAMLGKLGLANLEPDAGYLSGSTGPLRGARMLFTTETTAKTSTLEESLAWLDVYLAVGMQALEDAVCNWQKSPTQFRAFRG